jgi:polysaccharide transporter, PST family
LVSIALASVTMSFSYFAELRSRKNLLRIASSSAWLFGDKIIRAGLGAIVSVVIARHLGPDSFGVLSVAFTYVLLFVSAAGFGLDGVVVRDLLLQESSKNDILGTAFALKCCLGGVVFFLGNLVVGAAGLTNDGLWVMVIIGSFAVWFQAADIIDLEFQSRLDARASVVARSSAFITTAGVKLLLVVLGAPLMLFAATPGIEGALVAALLVLIYERKGGNIRGWHFESARAARLVKTAFPVALSGFFVVAIMQIDKLILGAISGSQAVGIYSAASLLSTVWYMVPVVVGASVAPTLTTLHATNLADYTKRLQDVFSVMTLAALCIGVFTALFSELLIGLIFGDAYSTATFVLTIHIWAGLFIAHVSIRSRALIIEGKMILVLLFSGLTLLSNIFLNLALINRYAEIGAAWAALISWASCALLFPLISSQSRGFVVMLLKSFMYSNWIRAAAR